MSLLTCPECNGKVSSNANTCPHCGYPIQRIKEKTVKQNTDRIIVCNKEYDFSEIKTTLNNGDTVVAIKKVAEKCNIKIIDAKLIIDVIKFNNNEIPSDYNECLERMRECNSRRANANVPKCPTCGSTNIQKISTAKRAGSIIGFGILSKNIGKTFECKKCGYKW